jgi:uncharacterized protein YdeI (YjbR/CyaY-like superfamily)
MSNIRRLCREILVGYEEGMRYGAPTYSKNGVVEVGLNSQKNYIALYILKKAVVDDHRHQLKDAGKGCIRYRKPQDIDYQVVAQLLDGTVGSSAEIC